MTIANTKTKNIFRGDGQNRRYAIDFPLCSSSDLRLIVTGPDGKETAVMTAFEISPALDYVIYPTEQSNLPPLAKDQKLTVCRRTPVTQELDLIQASALDKESLEKALDKHVMMTQELADRIARAVSVPESDEETPSSSELVQAMRDMYADAKEQADHAAASAQEAVKQAMLAYEQAEKLYTQAEWYTAGTPDVLYTGSLTDFQLANHYKADEKSLKVFVNGDLKKPGRDYDETVNPALTDNGTPYGDAISFKTALQTGTDVCFMWGDTLTMPGGEIAQQAADSARQAQEQAQAAAVKATEAEEWAEKAKLQADRFFPLPVGSLYFSSSPLMEDNAAGLPAWSGHYESKAADNYPEIYAYAKKHPEICLTRDEYDAMLAREKQVPFYVLDETPGSLRMPIQTRAVFPVRSDEKRGAYADQIKDHRHISVADAPLPYGNKSTSFSGGGGGLFGGGLDESVKTGPAEKLKDATQDLRVGDETWPAHSREYPWIVVKSRVDQLKDANGGVFKFWFGTEEEFSALAEVPDTQLSFIPEE